MRREFTRNQREQIVERDFRSKSKCLKWVEALIEAPTGTDDCIDWPFSKRETGYGQIFYHGRRTSSNNLICRLAHGPAPFDGAQAAHECGNRSCCNPKHIKWKTPQDNAADRVLHGTQPRGSRVYNAKLTEAQVVELRQLSREGVSLTKLARRFGICLQTASDIKHRKMWRHV